MLAPFFLESSQGRLYCALFEPSGKADYRTAVLFAPPFAEEMNKSRRMLARFGHAAAESGIPMLLPDLYGTGDSMGDFGDADWRVWQTDLVAAAAWLAARGCERLILAGLRAGCLLALDSLAKLPIKPSLLLFWNPVLSGQQMLTQFLRLRVASTLTKGGAKETTTDLRRRLAAGESVEIAGYDLAPGLALPLDQLVLKDLLADRDIPVHSFDVVTDASRPPAPAVAALLQDCRDRGLPVYHQQVPGDAFWATQELVDAPELVTASVRLITPDQEPVAR